MQVPNATFEHTQLYLIEHAFQLRLGDSEWQIADKYLLGIEVAHTRKISGR